jgi:sRNA-binding protein
MGGFPRCFFVAPEQRLPLKRTVVDDLEQQRVLDRNKLDQTVSWYCGHYAYRYSLVAGATRIDLDGNKAGVVTPAEQEEARAYIKHRKQEMLERQEATSAAVTRIAAVRQVGSRAVVAPTVPSNRHPTIGAMQGAVEVVSNILGTKTYGLLQPVLATAALKEIVNHAEQLIGELTTKPQASETSNGQN